MFLMRGGWVWRTMWACAGLCLCACSATVTFDDGSLTPPPPSSPPSYPLADPLPRSPSCGEASDTPELSWEYRAGTTTTQDYVSAVAVDAEGNVYLTGMAGRKVDFGGGPLDGHAGYVASLTADGEYRWSRFLQGSDWGSAIAVTQSGQVLVAGSFSGPLELGGESYDAGQRNMGYVVALTSLGEVLWHRAFGEGRINIATGVAISPDDGVILTGSFQGAADFGGGMRQASGGRDMFVAAYDVDGNHRWDVTPPGPGDEIAIGVAADSAGRVTITGHFSAKWDLGGGIRHPDGSHAVFVLQVDDQGEYQWDWTHGFGGGGRGHAVAVTSNGKVFVTGEFHGGLSFAGTDHPQSAELSSYVVAFDADGAERWGRTYGSTGAVRAFAIAVDESDRVLVAGHFGGEALFGETSRASAGGYDIFALMLTNSGEHLWDRTFGGPQDEEGHAIARGCSGTLFVGGRDPGNDTGNLTSMDTLLLAFD